MSTAKRTIFIAPKCATRRRIAPKITARRRTLIAFTKLDAGEIRRIKKTAFAVANLSPKSRK